MKISIALCTLNGEKFLPEQLESIMRQTRQPDEMIVCDDGSADHTLDVVRAFEKTSPFPVNVIINKETLGSIKNFEKAIQLCSGDIIALSDQDDVWKQHKLEVIEDTFRSNESAGYVFSDGEAVDENLDALGYSLWDAAGFRGTLLEMYTSGNQLLCFLRRRFVTGAAMSIRSSVRDLITPFPTDTDWVHDSWIAAVLSSCGAVGVAVPDKLIQYRRHPEQQIGVSRPQTDGSCINEYTSFSKARNPLWQGWLWQGQSFLYLKQRLETLDSRRPAMIQSIAVLEQFERHFTNRKLIHSRRGFHRLKPVLEEMVSGRYGLFSNSWKSAFRDLFLN